MATEQILHRARVAVGFPSDTWQALVTALPGPIGFRLRERFWRRRVRHMGANVRIEVGVTLAGASYIQLSDNCYLDRNVVIHAGSATGRRRTRVYENPDFPFSPGDVFIGENVRIAQNCILVGLGGIYVGRNAGIAANSCILSYSHHYSAAGEDADRGQYSFTSQARNDQESMISGAVFIGDYCAVGVGSTILPGTSLRRGTWVSCNAVVRGRFDEQSLIRASNPSTIESLSHLTIRE